MKVLIVDDESLVRRSLMRAFMSAGHECFETQDGIEGLSKWRESNFDLIFLDVLMPGLTGPQVLTEISDDKKKSTAIILISAFSGEHSPETAVQMGADLFIAKPFENIFAIVREAELLIKRKLNKG